MSEENMLPIVFKLMDRGLSAAQIDRAMKLMIGNDWREVNADVWLARLKRQGYVLQNEKELAINDLEALVKGRIVLDDLRKEIT